MKLKRILSGFLAGAVALSSMVFSSSASAETALDPWYLPYENCDGSSSNYENYNLAQGFADGYDTVTTVVINLTVTNGNWGWLNGNIYANINDGADPTIKKFNDDRVASQIQYGATDNGDLYFTEGSAIDVELDVTGRDLTQYHAIAIQVYGGALQINDIKIYNGSTLLNTVRGEAVTPVDPTTDVALNNITGTNDSKTISVAAWDGVSLENTNWEINFYDQIAAKAEAADFASAYNYMTRFWGVEFTFNLSAYSGDVAIPGLRAQSYAQTAGYGWVESDDYKVGYTADDIGETLTFRLPFSLLSEDTYRAVGMFVADETNFTTAGQTASISYTATAKLLKEEPIDTYAIDVAVTENGAVTPKVGGVTAYEAEEDTTVALEVTPDEGYELDTLTVTSESGTSVEVSDDNTFVMPGEGVKVAATFKKSVYNVTVATATNGTVSVDKTTASMGDTVTIKTTPAENYELASLSVTAEGGADVEVSDDNTFVMPADNVKVSASFSAKDAEKFTVTVETPVNGTAKANVTEAAEGTEVTISATPNDGYELDAITVKTASGTAVTVTNGKFTMPAENVTVTVTFAEKAPEATGYDKVEANFDADTIVAQKATNADGTTNVRIVKMVKESDIANKGTVTFTLKNKAGTVKTVTSKNYYMSLVASGNKVTPKNGYVFLAITVTDIPEGEEVTCTDITLS